MYICVHVWLFAYLPAFFYVCMYVCTTVTLDSLYLMLETVNQTGNNLVVCLSFMLYVYLQIVMAGVYVWLYTCLFGNYSLNGILLEYHSTNVNQVIKMISVEKWKNI